MFQVTRATEFCIQGRNETMPTLQKVVITATGWRRRGSPATRKDEHGGGGRKDADLQRRVGCSGVGVRGDRTPRSTHD